MTTKQMPCFNPETGEFSLVTVSDDRTPSTGPCRSCGVVFAFDRARRMIESMREQNHPTTCALYLQLVAIEADGMARGVQ